MAARSARDPQMDAGGNLAYHSLSGRKQNQVFEIEVRCKATVGELQTPKTGSGNGGGEVTAATWQFYEDMHEVLGARPSLDPPVVVASYYEDPTPILEFAEPASPASASALSPSALSPSAPSTSAMACPTTPSPLKKRSNAILDFLTEESSKEQRRHEESEAKTDRFLALFEQMIEKM
ncbi:hypothetical protein DPEC_G00295660 [Dallia pectoralis]|uniref:Uncharacterized protein n=1 Tax=Dallia pectoralis TaxID=75939 RepID=A0ACC2FIZ6_DALPE|nr:hypothetical protein DPEC_G00295660 [Dallia pectoralis]